MINLADMGMEMWVRDRMASDISYIWMDYSAWGLDGFGKRKFLNTAMFMSILKEWL